MYFYFFAHYIYTYKEVAYNADMMREKAVEEAGAGAVQPCLIHNHLLTMVD